MYICSKMAAPNAARRCDAPNAQRQTPNAALQSQSDSQTAKGRPPYVFTPYDEVRGESPDGEKLLLFFHAPHPLSNFHYSPIYMEGYGTFQNVECYYQYTTFCFFATQTSCNLNAGTKRRSGTWTLSMQTRYSAPTIQDWQSITVERYFMVLYGCG